ncbi:MAG TPA: CRISPR-associated protein Cas4 [Rhizomicrobium sp.]|nr:CRISPR-associated protein Cas4 [Rhizomicrobium sp.]
MFNEDQLLPISALQHLLFCERQCALIHIEQIWAENRFTIEGQHLHRKAHAAGSTRRGDAWTARGLVLRSFRLGLVGKADVVEFHPRESENRRDLRARRPTLTELIANRWSAIPVEYKRGKPKTQHGDRVQLCAQALCLEEMLDIKVPAGELFYGKRRRRTQVTFDPSLRALTVDTAARLHALIGAQRTPPARLEPKCENCSLLQPCMPGLISIAKPMSTLVASSFRRHLAALGPTHDVHEDEWERVS